MLKTIVRHIYQHYRDMVLLGIAGAVIGIGVGAIDAAFGSILLICTGIRGEHFFWLVPFLPVAGAVIAFIYRKVGKNAGKGMKLVFQVGFGEAGGLPFRMIPLSMFGTWITHLFGGSAGREGVAVQIGAAVSNNVGRFTEKYVHIKDSRKLFLITGMAAGFSGLFQTPIAAVFFALEVMVIGKLEYHALFPATIASFAAMMTSRALGLEKFHNIIPVGEVSYNLELLTKISLLGLIFGLAGSLFAIALRFIRVKLMLRFPSPIKKAVIMGVALAVMMMVLHQGRYSGTGESLIEICFGRAEGNVYIYDWILKLLLTILTLSAGFMGGEVAPLFSVGATLGYVIAPIFGLPPYFCAALGYASVFGSASNTLLASIFVGAEIFGYDMLPYFLVTCIMSYIFNFNKSIYTSQRNIDRNSDS